MQKITLNLALTYALLQYLRSSNAQRKDPQLHALHGCCITGNQQLYGDIYVAF